MHSGFLCFFSKVRVCLVTSKAGSESLEGRQSLMLCAAANQMHIFTEN